MTALPAHDTARRRQARYLTLGLALLALGLVVAAGPGTRAGLWPWRFGFAILGYGTWIAAAALLAALVQIAVPAWRRPGPRLLLASLVAAAVAVVPPLLMRSKASRVPPIHDITTDAVQPPAFVALLPAREQAPNGAEYKREPTFGQQRAAYADIQPLVLQERPERVFQRALDAARALGWEVVASEAKSGRIEATDTTRWWGFKDDVVVRVRPEGDGTRVDVRSMSRVGRSDLGANAARVRAFLDRLR